MAKIPKESSKNRDITGGLPRVAELFEARKPKNAAIMSDIDGKIEFGKDYKVKRRVIIRPEDASQEPVEYMISKGKHLFVGEGDSVKRGDMLVDGSLVPHDILRILGIKAFANYMVNEVQKVYRMQGVKIDDKHIEVILNMMLRRVEVKSPGDTILLIGENVDKDVFEKVNKEVISFLFKGELPQENQQQIREARQTRPKEKLSEQKEEIQNLDERAAESRAAGQTQRQQQQVTETIVREQPKIGRNDKVTIKNVMSGESKQVKYKQAIPLIKKGEWVLTEH